MKPTRNRDPKQGAQARSPRRQRGQAMTEYAVLCLLMCLALFLPVPGQNQTAGQMLAAMLRATYSALSYFISLP